VKEYIFADYFLSHILHLYPPCMIMNDGYWSKTILQQFRDVDFVINSVLLYYIYLGMMFLRILSPRTVLPHYVR